MNDQQNGSSATYFVGAGSNDYYNQHPQQYSPPVDVGQPSPYSEGPTPAEGDRGILGALGGGASGAYVGRQTCHGFLGTVGGAIVGSLTEDWVKKKNRSRPCSPQPPPAQICYPPPQQPQTCPPPAHPVHCPPGQYGHAAPVAAATHTTVNVDSYAAAGMGYHQSPPHYAPHLPQSAHHPSYPAGKSCGHSGHCLCKVTATFLKS